MIPNYAVLPIKTLKRVSPKIIKKTNYKKIVLWAVFLAFFSMSAGAVKAVDNSALIQSLMQQIAALQAQLTQLQTQQGATVWCHAFNNYMVAGSTNKDVPYLQMALTQQGFDVSQDVQGIFGDNTTAAVVSFQGMYGIRQTGTVGPITRAKLNALYGCIATTTQPSITVTSSPTGSVIEKSNVRISWISRGVIKSLGIGFCPQGKPVEDNYCTEAATYSNTGIADFKLEGGVNLIPGQWHVVVMDTSNRSVYGVGADFTVVSSSTMSSQPSITITSPNGGEAWNIASTHSILWNSNGLNNTSGHFHISLIKGNPSAANAEFVIADTTNAGSYSWTVPATLQGEGLTSGQGYNIYKIRVY